MILQGCITSCPQLHVALGPWVGQRAGQTWFRMLAVRWQETFKFPLNNKISGWFFPVPYLSTQFVSEIRHESILKVVLYMIWARGNNFLKSIFYTFLYFYLRHFYQSICSLISYLLKIMDNVCRMPNIGPWDADLLIILSKVNLHILIHCPDFRRIIKFKVVTLQTSFLIIVILRPLLQ